MKWTMAYIHNILLVTILLSSAVFADFDQGSGTSEDPYLIYTVVDMNSIGDNSEYMQSHFKLMRDIDVSLGPEVLMQQIGSFYGLFDGNGHEISGFEIEEYDAGLFGRIGEGGVVKNLRLVDVVVIGKGSSGAIAGENYGTIANCYAEGEVFGDSSFGWKGNGGLAGTNLGSVIFCFADVHVQGLFEYTTHLGGLVGRNYGRISKSFALGNVQGGYDKMGGLVGYNQQDGVIQDCYAWGDVDGRKSIGGLVGVNEGKTARCYSTGKVTGDDNPGGLVGTYISPINGVVIDSYWDISKNNVSNGGKGVETHSMKSADTFATWNCNGSTVWTIDDNNDYPHLEWEQEFGVPIPYVCKTTPDDIYRDLFGSGDGSISAPYLISEADQLNSISSDPNLMTRCFGLVNDINLGGIEWNMIGDVNNPFEGLFDGNGYSVMNLNINVPERDQAKWPIPGYGMFGYVGIFGEIRHLGVVNSDIVAPLYAGGLAGKNFGKISQCFIKDCRIRGDGGLAGNNSGIVSFCYVSSDTTIDGGYGVGGLVGSNDGYITNCYSQADVSGQSVIAGLVGDNFRGSNDINYNSIDFSYSTGLVTATDPDWAGGLWAGGLVAPQDPYYTFFEAGVVEASFWDINASGQSISEGGEGKSKEEMQDKTTYLENEWSFTTDNNSHGTWSILSEPNYPVLWWQVKTANESNVYDGTGTEQDPYLISDVNGLVTIAANPSLMDKHFRLEANIDMNGVSCPPIGDFINPFSGVFDGNGYTISHFQYQDLEAKDLGFFNLIGKAGVVKNLVLANASVEGYENVGCLVGRNTGLISCCHVTGHAFGESGVGGLVGKNSGHVINSYVDANVVARSVVGGLSGMNDNGLIVNCYSLSSVEGEITQGGLIGLNKSTGRSIGSFYSQETTRLYGQGNEKKKSKAELMTRAIYLDAGWDFIDETANGTQDIWSISESGYPFLSIERFSK